MTKRKTTTKTGRNNYGFSIENVVPHNMKAGANLQKMFDSSAAILAATYFSLSLHICFTVWTKEFRHFHFLFITKLSIIKGNLIHILYPKMDF